MTVFLLEVLVKWAGLGIRKYFRDSWNRFDFAMALLGLFVSVLVSDMLLSDVKSLKMFKFAKMIYVIKVLVSLRSFEVLRVVHLTFVPVEKVKKMLYKILLCLPMVL